MSLRRSQRIQDNTSGSKGANVLRASSRRQSPSVSTPVGTRRSARLNQNDDNVLLYDLSPERIGKRGKEGRNRLLADDTSLPSYEGDERIQSGDENDSELVRNHLANIAIDNNVDYSTYIGQNEENNDPDYDALHGEEAGEPSNSEHSSSNASDRETASIDSNHNAQDDPYVSDHSLLMVEEASSTSGSQSEEDFADSVVLDEVSHGTDDANDNDMNDEQADGQDLAHDEGENEAVPADANDNDGNAEQADGQELAHDEGGNEAAAADAYNQLMEWCDLLRGCGLERMTDMLVAIEDIIARNGRSVFALPRAKENKAMRIIQRMFVVGTCLLDDHHGELSDHDRNLALQLTYNCQSVVYSFVRCKFPDDPGLDGAIDVLESIFGDVFFAPAGEQLPENFDISSRPFQDLRMVAIKFGHLVECLSKDLTSPEVPYEFKGDARNTKLMVNEHLRNGKMRSAMRTLESVNQPGGDDQHQPNGQDAHLKEEELRQLFTTLFPQVPDAIPSVDESFASRNASVFNGLPLLNGQPDLEAAVTDAELESILKLLDNSSSAGVDGLTAKLLVLLATEKETGGYSGTWYRRSLRRHLTRILQCVKVTEEERAVLTTSKVAFIPKNGQHNKYRPLGITPLFARLATRIALRRSSEYCQKILPRQLAAGVSDGCTLGAALMQAKLVRGYCVTLFDATNAFNKVSRGHIYEVMKEKFPNLLPLFSLLYGTESKAMLAKGIYLGQVSTGVKQGCCLAMLAFCLAMDPILDRLQEHTDSWAALYETPKISLVQGYADDLAIATDYRLLTHDPYDRDVRYSLEPGNLSPWLQGVHEICRDFNLELNSDKFEAILNPTIAGVNDGSETSCLPVEMDKRAAKYLGIPIGTVAGRKALLTKIVDKAKRLLCLDAEHQTEAARLLLDLNPADSFILIRACISTRLLHLCRSMPRILYPGNDQQLVAGQQPLLRDFLEDWDCTLRLWLRRKLGIPQEDLNDDDFSVITHLSVGKAGMGIRMLNAFQGVFAEKLFYDCTNNIIARGKSLVNRGHLRKEHMTALRSNRNLHMILPGSSLWAPGSSFYTHYGNWEAALYPQGSEQGVSVTNALFENNLLNALTQRILHADVNNSVGDLRHGVERLSAMVMLDSFCKGERSLWMQLAKRDPRDRLSARAYIDWTRLHYLQRPLRRGEMKSRCCDNVPLDVLNHRRPYHVFCCQKRQGGTVKRHDAVLKLLRELLTDLVGHKPDFELSDEPFFADTINDDEDCRYKVVYGNTRSRNVRKQGDGTFTVKPAEDRRADLKLVVDGHTYLIDLSVNVPFNLKQVVQLRKGEAPSLDSIAAAVKRSMTEAEGRKVSYSAKLLPDKALYDSLAFVPVVFSLGGGMGPQGTNFLKTLNGGAPLPGRTRMFLRLMAKTIIRKTCEHCWWPTLAFAEEANNEYDPDADHDQDSIDADTASHSSHSSHAGLSGDEDDGQPIDDDTVSHSSHSSHAGLAGDEEDGQLMGALNEVLNPHPLGALDELIHPERYAPLFPPGPPARADPLHVAALGPLSEDAVLGSDLAAHINGGIVMEFAEVEDHEHVDDADRSSAAAQRRMAALRLALPSSSSSSSSSSNPWFTPSARGADRSSTPNVDTRARRRAASTRRGSSYSRRRGLPFNLMS